jgi:hypothetical protein
VQEWPGLCLASRTIQGEVTEHVALPRLEFIEVAAAQLRSWPSPFKLA